MQKYLLKDINYGKAAKRMYNIFRLTGHYEEAAFLRELFDGYLTGVGVARYLSLRFDVR